MDFDVLMRKMAQEAREASGIMASAPTKAKASALKHLADLIESEREAVFEANGKDVESAGSAGMSGAKLKRLRITPKVLDSMIQGCLEVAAMSDPVGGIEDVKVRPNGLLAGKMRIPLGVVAMIYESRPNATTDAAILCLMAGNACILRGGSEAFNSNTILAGLISRALLKAGLPEKAAQIVPYTQREAVSALLKLDDLVDVVIPRGGEGLIRAVTAEARMPVLKHYKGVCHVYADKGADLDKAVRIIHNAKVQSPAVCNALECLLVHEDEAMALLPEVARVLGEDGVSFRACPVSLPLLGDCAIPAAEDDFGKEFLDLVLAVKVVRNLDEAMKHIATYGSNHTEAIITDSHANTMRFLREVDASLVLVNASTRFNDGGQLGLGAEIGISTSKLHAYGPMGLKELTTTKYVAFGNGQVRE